MDEPETIVVGVDGSAESQAALAHAFADAARRGARVRVVSVFQPPQYWAISYGVAVPPSEDQVTADVRTRICELVGAVVAGRPGLAEVPVELRAVPGTPAKVLIDESRDAALLVLGHRGRGRFTSALLGSAGMQCVLNASCPVTIVRPGPVPAGATATAPGATVPAPA
ncbi:universal stress protein [Pseudonocardia bannensis]|uniref:Universal stress protein n=1 Tax=Pseudonocardia bannensis TaxID=630973 RepID=A0A848DS43_9PSEU|nr:universal stress protein [Pseudonocardia bannensis]NMH95299.1 universal stress protein [Pseudonocardia bannensis]